MPARGSAALAGSRASKAVEQRARPVARGRVDDHAGGLVDDEHVVVLVDDRDRQRLGAVGAALLGRLQRRPRCAGRRERAAPALATAAPSTLT